MIMKSIFEALHFTLSDNTSKRGRLELLVIHNPDGTPRWITPRAAKKPLFLKFYHRSTLRSWLIYSLIQLIYLLRVQRFLLKRRTVYLHRPERQLFDPFGDNWALFTGTPGPNNKLVIYTEMAESGRFIKVATTQQAKQLLQNEDDALWKLNFYSPQHLRVPTVVSAHSNTIELTDISRNGGRTDHFGKPHFKALSEIYSKTSERIGFDTLIAHHALDGKLSEMMDDDNSNIPKAILRKLTLLIESLKGTNARVSMGHGDFTPWNMYVADGILGVYDWELSNSQLPVGYDAFHFIIQKGILIERKPWKEIRKELHAAISAERFSAWTCNELESLDLYLKMYLAINTVNNLKLYSRQKHWHPQVHWMLATWNEALSDVMQGQKSPRELIIMDLFDLLHHKNYAAIKFPNHLPERLSEYSDIDLCIERKDLNTISQMLLSNPVVKQLELNHQTFMRNLRIVCTDGSILSVDLIWKIKYKGLEMMDAKQVLADAYVTHHGIKLMRLIDKVRYIGLFYGLNNRPIPSKLEAYEQILDNSTTELDRVLSANYSDSCTRRPELKSCIQQLPQNKAFARILNHIGYALDSLRQFFGSQGMVISFSGVDGAGKSTIIENTKQELEKKLRRRVVVLRHRPSFLPILSAWTKGRKRAEKDATESLPRQGKNTSAMSSALRFLYYYTDYFFGQFIVNLIYKRRGFIVLYDRYFFDFIIDGKRSNIQLPEGILKRAYRLLFQPDFNFFLYADANLILERKQELSKDVINELTQRYIDLFKGLGSRKRSAKYISVENVDLHSTVSLVVSTTQLSIAS